MVLKRMLAQLVIELITQMMVACRADQHRRHLYTRSAEPSMSRTHTSPRPQHILPPTCRRQPFLPPCRRKHSRRPGPHAPASPMRRALCHCVPTPPTRVRHSGRQVRLLRA